MTAPSKIETLTVPRLTVQITQEMIDTAVKANSSHCMIAEGVKAAFLRKFGRPPIKVAVDWQSIAFTDQERELRFTTFTPRIGQLAIWAFDQGRRDLLKPFKFVTKGGQITPMSPTGFRSAAASKRSWKKSAEKAQALRRLKKPLLRVKRHGSISPTRTKIGGEPPPEAMLPGKRRLFGLKSFTVPEAA